VDLRFWLSRKVPQHRPTARVMRSSAVAAGCAAMLALAACSSGGGDTTTSDGKTLTTITVGGVQTANLADLYAGLMNGVFKKYGINLQYQVLTPTAAVAAVDSGSIDIGDDGAGMVEGLIQTHAAKIFMQNGPGLFYLAVPKSIHTLADLRGKTVSASTPGGAIDTAIRDALKAVGVTVGTGGGDVHMTYLQNNSAALVALKNGTVDGAGVSPPTTVQAEQEGMHLIPIVKYSYDSVWAVNNSFASSHHQAIVNFAKAFAVATKDSTSDQQLCQAGLKKYVQITDQAQLTGSCLAYKHYLAAAPYPLSQLKEIEAGLKPPSTVSPASLVDNSYMNAVGKANWVEVTGAQ
jgi:ABC-type nitrate/sulfonate/bicarbonate transport system substrate-binding protein